MCLCICHLTIYFESCLGNCLKVWISDLFVKNYRILPKLKKQRVQKKKVVKTRCELKLKENSFVHCCVTYDANGSTYLGR